ncbi:MAG: ParA family protein [Bacteroides sp.]
MDEIISITNDKGGVGKTTTAQNLSAALMLKGKKVLLIDADSQLYSSYCCGWTTDREQQGDRTLFSALSKPSPLPVYKSLRGVYFTPSSKQMAGIENFLSSQMSPNTVLRAVLNRPVDDRTGEGIVLARDFFDFIIIDCPPSLGSETLNAMAASTGLIIPVQLEGFSVVGIGEVTARFKGVQEELNPSLRILGFLLVMVDKRLRKDSLYHNSLKETFDDLVFDTVIRRNTRIPESQDSFQDIFDYDSTSAGAKDYRAFCEELLSMLESKTL